MNRFSFKQYSIFFLIVALCLLAPLILKKQSEKTAKNKTNDLFNEKLLPFNSVSKVVHFLDYSNQVKKILLLIQHLMLIRPVVLLNNDFLLV